MLDQLFEEKSLGTYGEKLTERELKVVKLLGRNGRILKNIYIPKDDGGTTEIDIVFISQKGIFVIESKNFSGWIFGDEKSAYWTAMLPNRQKNRFYSPILQNSNHIKWLENYLWINLYNDIPMYSFIVFSERCELKKMTVTTPDVRVMKRNRLYVNIADVWESAPDILSEQQVTEIYKLLKQLTEVNKTQKQAHIDAIREKYQSPKEGLHSTVKSEVLPQLDMVTIRDSDVQTNNAEPQEVLQTCPKCGGELVLRVSKKGVNAGKQFYGCTNFPKCRFIKDFPQPKEQENKAETVHCENEKPLQELPKSCPWCGNMLVLRTTKNGQNAGKNFYGCSSFPKCRYIQNI